MMQVPTNILECLSRVWPIADVEEFLASYDPIALLEYTGPGAEPISEEDLNRCGGEKKRAQAVRIYDRFGKLAENTMQSYQTHWNHFKTAIAELNKRPEHEGQPLSILAHPTSNVAAAAQIVVDSLLKGNNLKGSVDSFQNAMVKLRECQLGIPRPGSLKDDAWFRGTLETAGRVTAKRKLAPEANSLLGTEETTTLKPHEYEQLIDTIRAGAHTSLDTVELLGEWKSGGSTCATSYLAKSQSSALPAHLALAGFKGSFHHHLGRAEVHVPDAWVDEVMPGVRDALKVLLEQHQGLKCHEKEIGAETFFTDVVIFGDGILAEPPSQVPQIQGQLYAGSSKRDQWHYADSRVQNVC
ncbi:hypothetical protein KSW81_004504 [Nannochloris sp. 'desiccata']|nr:hypothetical protein KSW81_004504 [Chlorella desiccata (nom. nud.)]